MRRHLAFLSLAAALALTACKKPPPPRQTDAQQARAVRVVRLEPHAISGALSATGDLLPREEAAVFAEVSGYRVAQVLVDVGQVVRKGQTLIKLDPALIESQVAQQEALAHQAEVNAEQAEDQANRVKGLDDQGVLAQEQIDQRRFQARAARATANAQAAALRDMKTRWTKLNVTAPVSGLVLEKTVRPGDMSSTAGATPWFRLARDSEIELQAQLSEDDLARLHAGQRAEVTLPSGTNVPGVVRLVSPQIDTQTKLGAVRVRLPVRGDIRAGGFGRAVFGDVSGAALALPETAIRYDADGAGVMVVGSDNRVRRVLVQTGQRGNGYVQLLKGPPAGSQVVAAAAALLMEGEMVRPIDQAPAATPAPIHPAGVQR